MLPLSASLYVFSQGLAAPRQDWTSQYSRPMERDWRTEWPTERIATVAEADGATYLDPAEVVRLVLAPTGYEPIVARTIIEVGGLFLVESVDDPDNWYMGQRSPDGVLECWGQYGVLASALRSL
jgi:hypothetical protein